MGPLEWGHWRPSEHSLIDTRESPSSILSSEQKFRTSRETGASSCGTGRTPPAAGPPARAVPKAFALFFFFFLSHLANRVARPAVLSAGGPGRGQLGTRHRTPARFRLGPAWPASLSQVLNLISESHGPGFGLRRMQLGMRQRTPAWLRLRSASARLKVRRAAAGNETPDGPGLAQDRASSAGLPIST